MSVDDNGFQSTTNDSSSQLCVVCVTSQYIPGLPLGCPLCGSVIISTSDKPPKYQRGVAGSNVNGAGPTAGASSTGGVIGKQIPSPI